MAGPVRFPNMMTPYSSPMGMAGVGPERRLSANTEVEGVSAGEAGESAHGVHRPFSDYLAAQIHQVNDVNKEADTAVANMVTGRSGNLHETMLALDKADVSFRMLTKVRNKVVEAYHEVMRMSI